MAECGDLACHLAAVQIRCSAGLGPVQEPDLAGLLTELRALVACIDRARSDLAVLGAEDIVDRQVPAAADELDAIVNHTAAATSTILDECEHLELAVAGREGQEVVSAATARIYEACSFQDITGQRVAKVVQTLQVVEARVDGMLRVFGRTNAVGISAAAPVALLNGPQRPSHAMDQMAVDALLEGME